MRRVAHIAGPTRSRTLGSFVSMVAMATFLGSVGGCYDQQPYTCVSPDDCGEGGLCESNGWCSFPDAECGTGRRYGHASGEGLANTCVDSEGATSGAGTSAINTTGTSPSTSATNPTNPTGSSASTSGSTTAASAASSTTSDPAESDTTTNDCEFEPCDDTTSGNPSTSGSSTTDPSTSDPSATEGSSTTDDEPACEQLIVDDFNDGSIGNAWSQVNTKGGSPHAMVEASGQLRWTLQPDVNSFIGLRQEFSGDLRYVRMQIGDAPPAEASHAQVVGFIDGFPEIIYMVWGFGGVDFRYPDSQFGWSSTEWVEVRFEGGSMHVSSSNDGENWQLRGTHPVGPGSIDPPALLVYGQTWTEGPGTIATSLDRVEVCLD